MNRENIRKISALLDSSRRLGQTAPENIVVKILTLINDYKIDEDVKRKALLSFPAIAIPSNKTVDIITNLCLRLPPGLENELVQVPTILAKKCKESVDYVIACVGALYELRKVLYELHCRLSRRPATEENEHNITELRNGIVELTQIIVAFQDFINIS